MRLDLVSGEKWEKSRETAKKILGSSNQVWVHRGLASAIYEVLESLRSLFAHKKSISGMRGLSGAYEFIWPQYLREMYTVQNASWTEFLDHESVTKFFDGLKKDTIFFIWSEDHPVTGHRLPVQLVQEIERQLNERKIFSVRISHAAHFEIEKDTEQAVLPAFSVLIRSVQQNLSVVEAGLRFKATLLVSGNSEWSVEETHQVLIQSITSASSDQQKILNFEKQFPDENQWFSDPLVPRIYDRAALVFEDINGDYLAALINKKLGLKDEDLLVRTTSLCSLDEATRIYSSWWLPLPTENQLRGMIFLDLKILTNSNLVSAIQHSLSEIRKLQSGN